MIDREGAGAKPRQGPPPITEIEIQQEKAEELTPPPGRE